VGFLDSFFGGVNTFLQSPIGTAVGQLGIAKLADVIGLRPTGASGSPRSGGPGTVFSPLGRPASGGQIFTDRDLRLFQEMQLQKEHAVQLQRQREEQAFFLPGGPGNPIEIGFRGGGPQPVSRGFSAPVPSVPASQPFGVQPGAGFAPLPVGATMAAFPTTVQASFPPNPFTSANPFFQPASLPGIGGAIARQIPGIIGGAAAGLGLEAFVGGNGAGTPMFRPTMAGARAQFFRIPNPASGQDTWFRPAGKPLLWSGDLTACKRVKKVARKAARKR